MQKRSAIATVAIAAVIAVAAIWSLTEGDETDVYSAFLAPFPDAAPVLTSRPSTCMATIPVAGIPDELVRSFLKANRKGSTAISLTRLRWNYDTAKPAKLRRVAQAGLYPGLFLPKGKALVYLSRVGFSADNSSALFCVENKRGLLVYLRKVDGMWREVSVEATWTAH